MVAGPAWTSSPSGGTKVGATAMATQSEHPPALAQVPSGVWLLCSGQQGSSPPSWAIECPCAVEAARLAWLATATLNAAEAANASSRKTARHRRTAVCRRRPPNRCHVLNHCTAILLAVRPIASRCLLYRLISPIVIVLDQSAQNFDRPASSKLRSVRRRLPDTGSVSQLHYAAANWRATRNPPVGAASRQSAPPHISRRSPATAKPIPAPGYWASRRPPRRSTLPRSCGGIPGPSSSMVTQTLPAAIAAPMTTRVVA